MTIFVFLLLGVALAEIRIICNRCFIPECEPIGSGAFDPDWLNATIPYIDGRPQPCYRYEYVPPLEMNIAACSAENFNQSNVVRCNSFIIRNNQETLASHVKKKQNINKTPVNSRDLVNFY